MPHPDLHAGGVSAGVAGARGDARGRAADDLRSLLGLFRSVRLAEQSVALGPGDKVLFYTDAIVEASGADDAMLDVAGLGAFVKSAVLCPSTRCSNRCMR
jgi:serine phosphatase RsbU (regulator of sigma subunit)